MIYSEDDLNRRFANFIKEGMGDLIARPHFGVPEEEVVKENTYPYLTLFYLYDELSVDNWLSGNIMKVRKNSGVDTIYERWKMPEAVKFYYQLDIYSQSQQKMVQLSKELSRVIPRRGASMPDADGDLIAIERTDVQDFSRDSFRLEKSEERLFRRTMTYSLDCYYQPNDEPIETVGPVLSREIMFEVTKEL